MPGLNRDRLAVKRPLLFPGVFPRRCSGPELFRPVRKPTTMVDGENHTRCEILGIDRGIAWVILVVRVIAEVSTTQ